MLKRLDGANMDIDLVTDSDKISWKQEKCPWNVADKTSEHRCAIKNTKICPYFCGVEYLDYVLCSYPEKNPNKK